MSMTTSIATKSCAYYLVFRGFFLLILGEEGFEDVSETTVDTDVGLPVVKVDVDLRVAQRTATSIAGNLGSRVRKTFHVRRLKRRCDKGCATHNASVDLNRGNFSNEVNGPLAVHLLLQAGH